MKRHAKVDVMGRNSWKKQTKEAARGVISSDKWCEAAHFKYLRPVHACVDTPHSSPYWSQPHLGYTPSPRACLDSTHFSVWLYASGSTVPSNGAASVFYSGSDMV